MAHLSDSLQDLAQLADAAAERCVRTWEIGHELAAALTTSGRAMTPPEVALVQALERGLDWSGGDGRFRAWWLDEDSSLDETDADWPETWASVADFAEHPAIVAQLSDLLWVARHGTPHLHARRAIDAYIALSARLNELHDRGRSLIRAHELAGSVNDEDRLRAAEVAICESVDTALVGGELGVALALLDRVLSTRRLSSEAEPTVTELLQRTFDAAVRADHIERAAKLVLRRNGEGTEKQAIAARVVDAFRSKAEREDGFARLIALRDALRVAEELGHPAHDEILNEIETLDSESAFTAIRTEQVLSREVVSRFCAGVVGNDSLDDALSRFAAQLPISPESVQHLRDTTPISIRHVITNVRIGEANSVVTSTETDGDDGDRIAAALERDVLQSVGHQAQMMAFLFLVPALHQLLESYHPWTVADVRTQLESGNADTVVADALARSLEHFSCRRYDEAAHVALPRVERLIRHIARSCGVATTKRATKRVGGIRGLGEILADLRGDGTRPILPEPLLTAAELTLVDPDSLNLRNDFLHGVTGAAKASDAALILQLGLALAIGIRLGPEGSH